MGPEEDRGPDEVEGELSPPQTHRPAVAVTLPGAPPGDADEDIERRPDRTEDPARRIEGGLVERRIPLAGRRQEADREAAADRETEEQEQGQSAVHGGFRGRRGLGIAGDLVGDDGIEPPTSSV